MQPSQRALQAALIAAFLVSGSFALYYREQASRYKREYESAVALLSVEQSSEGTPTPLPAAADAIAMRHERTQQKERASDGDSPLQRPAPVDGDPTDIEGDGTFPTNDIVGSVNMDWMETLRRTDPAKYEEARKLYEEREMRRQKARDNAVAAWNNATNYFANRKTSGMNEKQLAEYNRMLVLLNETWDIKQEVLSNKLRPDDRRTASSMLQSNMVALAQMLENERTQEYRDLAIAMGQTEAEAAAFAGYVNQIASNTSINAIFPDLFQRGGGTRGGRGVRTDRGR